MCSVSPVPVEVEAAAAMAAARVRRLDWVHGDCLLRMSSSTDGLRVRRPLVSGHLELQIDRFRAAGRQQYSRQSIGLPIHTSAAASLATVPGARETALRELMMDHHGLLPDEALRGLVVELSDYIRVVAAAAVRAEAAPLLIEVYADARVRMFMAGEASDDEEEEGEEGDDGADWEDMPEDVYTEPPWPSAAALAETAALGGQLVPEEEEAEGESCAICLEKMAAARGGQERRWLPCSHSFHGACLERWRRRRAQCPLCRMDLMPPGT